MLVDALHVIEEYLRGAIRMQRDDERENKMERRPWAYREEVIQRYCSCMWATVANDEENSRAMTYRNPECKLHGDNPLHDLPDGL